MLTNIAMEIFSLHLRFKLGINHPHTCHKRKKSQEAFKIKSTSITAFICLEELCVLGPSAVE